ncbi:acyl--CoA ligase [Acetobacteraceae bacterium]|nr:acyl--CoA ligase [Acetobacteraceae bacterium]
MPDQFVACNAALYPERTALDFQGGSLTFLALERVIQKIASVLIPLKTQAPRLVAIDFENYLHHWMIFLALSRLSLTCCTLPPEAAGETKEALEALAPDVIIGGKAIESASQNFEYLTLGPEWFQQIFVAEPPAAINTLSQPDFEISETSPFYVALAGASVGGFQPVILTRSKVREGGSRLLWMDAVMSETPVRPIFVSTVHPSMLTGFLSVCSALSSGALVRFHNPANPAAAFAGKGPFLAILTPSHLAIVLDSIGPVRYALPDISLVLGGGRASNRLLERCYKSFTQNVRLVYATDETGPITMVSGSQRIAPEHAGPVMPWADVKILDEDGEPVPMGEMGEIWVRVDDGISGYQTVNSVRGAYFGANARYFQNGWFFTGDRGKLFFKNGIREIWLEGRADDLVTLGGGKYDLAKIDAVLAEDPNVQDAGSFIYTDGEGRERLSCAVVPKEGCELDFKSLSKRFHDLYPGLPPLPLFRTTRLPRDNFGMVERHLLAAGIKGRIPEKLGGEA